MSKFKLTYDEKRYLLGLLHSTIEEHKDILETEAVSYTHLTLPTKA